MISSWSWRRSEIGVLLSFRFESQCQVTHVGIFTCISDLRFKIMSSGGRAQTKVKGKVRERHELKETRLKAAVSAIGQETCDHFKTLWDSLETGYGQKHYEIGNGIIKAMLELGMSVLKVMGALGKVGQKRIERVRCFDPKLEKKTFNPSWNAFSS